MIRRSILSVGITLSLLLPALATNAAAPSMISCQTRILDEMTAAKDTYRSYLYGSERSGGKVRVKSGGTTTHERQGIFGTPGHLTSDLVPAVMQSYQAYRCRLQAICALSSESLYRAQGVLTALPNTETTLDSYMLGCDADAVLDNRNLYPECQGAGVFSFDEFTSLLGFCGTMATQTLKVERETLKLAVAYDATYRSMMQFAGILDWMLGSVGQETIVPLRDAVRWLGRLHTIPCFIGQCDQSLPSQQAPRTSSSSSVSLPQDSQGQGFPTLAP